jgi:NADH dehydrogenase
MSKKVVIIGGGFGGIAVARALKKADVQITLIDKNNHHLFLPLLYQVATAVLDPSDVAFPIRDLLRKQKNTWVVMDEAENVDIKASRFIQAEGNMLTTIWLSHAACVALILEEMSGESMLPA